MESFRIGRWEMIGWEFLPADMAGGERMLSKGRWGGEVILLFYFFLYKGIVLYLSRHLIFEKVGEHHLIRSSYGISLTY